MAPLVRPIRVPRPAFGNGLRPFCVAAAMARFSALFGPRTTEDFRPRLFEWFLNDALGSVHQQPFPYH
jgi:hypothetical protein